uniref:Monocarboxylate transporter 9-like n=1 Tax=Diabrotica virgifera virgifera TaxID=50390 RepID=A0A6P7FY16_DIAVI
MAHAPPARKRKQSQEHDIHKFQGKESILTSQIELYIEDVKPKIPDGGWGWMIVLAAFVVNGISEGISFSFGLLYVEFLNAFDASKSATSWIGSLFLAMPLLAGPIGSAMVDRYGCIYMTVLGSLISTSGFILSMFVKSLTMLYITFGIIGGIGKELFIYQRFIYRRNVKRSRIFKNDTISLLYRRKLEKLLLVTNSFFRARVKKAKKAAKKRKAKIKRENTQLLLQRINTTLDLSEKNHFRSVVDLPTFVKENEKVPLEVLNRLSENKQMYKIILENYPNMVPSKSASNQDLHVQENGCKTRVPVKFSLQVQEEPEDEQPEDNKGENGKVENHTSPLLYTIPEAIEEPEPHSYLQIMTMSSPNLYNASRSTRRSGKSPSKEVPQKVKKKWYTQFWKLIKGLLNFSLFLELHFLLLAVSTIILFTWFIVPYFYIAEYMLKLGYTDSQASSVLSAIGLTNTIGMVFLGWAGERLNIAKTYALCLIVCGGTIAGIIWLSGNYITLLIACGLFGLFFASCFSLLPSLLGELVPLEDFTMAYGLILLCMGIGNLSGPPLSGFIYDLTKTWNMSFYQAACWIIFSGVLIGIIPYTKNRKIVGSGPVLNEQ